MGNVGFVGFERVLVRIGRAFIDDRSPAAPEKLDHDAEPEQRAARAQDVRRTLIPVVFEVDVRRRMLLRVWPFMRVKLCVAQVGLPSARC